MIHGPDGIRASYRDESVAQSYIERRFREPLGAMLHDRQLARMRDVIHALQPRRVLEIAPGPARLTLDLAADFPQGGTLVDTSKEMLAEARARLAGAGHPSWHLVQGDAFCLPFCGPFDLIYSFRLIRHFDDAERARLYAGIARLLRPGGFLVFDAVNEEIGRTIRQHAGGACQHYDALLSPRDIASELDAAGFGRVQLDDVQRRFGVLYQLQVLVAPRSRWLARAAMEIVARIPGGRPLEWIVTCQRR